MKTLAIAWVLSTVIILNLKAIPSVPVLLLSALISIVCLFSRPYLRYIAVGFIASVVTVTVSMAGLMAHQLPPELAGSDLDLTVAVASIPERDDRRMTFLATVLDCHSCIQSIGVKRVRLSWYGPSPTVRAGEQWRLTARLRHLRSLRNPGGFDRLRWAVTQGLHATGYVRDGHRAIRTAPARSGTIHHIRQELSVHLRNLPSAGDHISLVTALSLGLKAGIDTDTRDLLRDTGTAHLLAISGLHISLIALWGFAAGRFGLQLWRAAMRYIRPPAPPSVREQLCLYLSFSFALFYTLLSGAGLPAQRALVMITVMLVATACVRLISPVTALAIAATMILFVAPLSVLSVGFWLSFGTVTFLLFLHRGYLRPVSGFNQTSTGQQQAATAVRAPSHPGDNSNSTGAAVSIVAACWSRLSATLLQGAYVGKSHLLIGLCLLPVTAWFFQSGSIVAPLANLIAVPWTGLVIVPLSLTATLLAPAVPFVADVVLTLAQLSIAALLVWLAWLDKTLVSSVVLSLPDVRVMALCVLGLICLLSPRGLKLRLFSLPLLLPALSFNLHNHSPEGFELHVLDVGQGLAALVYSDDQTVLFDTGGKVSGSLSMYRAVVEPFLYATGRRKIDLLIVSHADEDHAFGVQEIVQKFPDVRVISSRFLPLEDDVRQEICRAGQQWMSGSVIMSFLHPAGHDRGGRNDLSCVLLAAMGKSRVVLTGDIEQRAEQKLARRMPDNPALPVNVLVAPHHGSSTSSSHFLLELFQPENVVFAAGFRNRYGFPHSEVQLRYESLGSHAFITGYDGAVSFLLGESGLYNKPGTWWQSHRRFWHVIVNPDCWQESAGQSTAARLLELARIGRTMCGK